MDRGTRERRTPRRAVSIVTTAALALGAFALLAPAAEAANPPCKVTNLATLAVYGGSGSNLQTAIDAANAGVTLQVQGVCVGNFTISQDLTLKGRTSTAYPKKARLDGNAVNTVITIESGTVSLRNLKITNGSASNAGGIYNHATLSLDGTTAVTGNSTSIVGAGIFNDGDLTMNDSSSVTANGTAGSGAGIYNGGGTVTMNGHAKVAKNSANGDGGGFWSNGDVTMNGRSSVRGNISFGYGGGYLTQGTLTMNDYAAVLNNKSQAGAGMFVSGAVTMNESSTISGNTTGGNGGGVVNSAAFTMNDLATITGNTADLDDNGSGTGGGLWDCFGGTLTGVTDGGNVVGNHLGDGTENNVVTCV